MKKAWLIALAVAIIYAILNNNGIDILTNDLSQYVYTIENTEFAQQDLDNTIIGSFNIQTFGPTKFSKPEVLDILVNISCNFDILAIQEFRDSSENTPKEFFKLVNDTCPSKKYVLSPRLGRTSSKESYMIIYSDEFENIANEVLRDPEDRFEREPQIATFLKDQFKFTIVNNHIQPTNAFLEIDELSTELEYMEIKYGNNLILLGDFNADCSYFDESQSNSFFDDYIWAIPNTADTTVAKSSCTYDRIILSPEINEFRKNNGVYRFDKHFNTSFELTKNISDHYPVWVSFNFTQ